MIYDMKIKMKLSRTNFSMNEAKIFDKYVRAVARSENPGGLVVLGGDNVPPLVNIGLTDLPKSGCAMAHPAHPGKTGLFR